jgi:hypothetical protein
MLTATKAPRPRASQLHVVVLLALSALLFIAAAALVAVATNYYGGDDDAPAVPAPTGKPLKINGATLPAAIAPQATTPSDPEQIRPIDRDSALAWNAAIPVSDQPMARAAPFRLDIRDTQDWDRAVDCLTAAVYYEAAIEPNEGQRAVAQVILNRVRHPAYPHTVCGVVFQGSEKKTGCQFTFSCDGALRHPPNVALWGRARSIAVAALAGYVYAPVGLATHYHTNWIVPYWASSLVKLANVGTHIFYRWDGGWGAPKAFSIAYRGAEPAFTWRGGFGQTGEELAAITGLTLPGVDPAQPATVPTERPLLGMNPATATDPAKAPAQPGTDVDTNQRWVLRGGAAPAAPVTPPPVSTGPKTTAVLPAGS